MTSPVSAAHIQVLSAGAPKGGVAACAAAFSRDTAHEVVYRFATAPVLRAQVEKGEAEADIVIAPVPSMAKPAPTPNPAIISRRLRNTASSVTCVSFINQSGFRKYIIKIPFMLLKL